MSMVGNIAPLGLDLRWKRLMSRGQVETVPEQMFVDDCG